jgi:hypothetical protein
VWSAGAHRIYGLLLIGSIAVALYAWRSIPSQRSWRNVGDWSCRFFIGTMCWQQTLWKGPRYTPTIQVIR